MKEKIQEAMRAAMKAGQKQRVGVLRMLIAEINNACLAGREAAGAVAAYGRRLEKSIAEYDKLGQADRVEQLKAEHAVVSEYLPQRLSDEETETLVEKTIAQEGLESVKDVGRGMKAIMSTHGPRVDGQKVMELLKQKLG